MNMTQLNLAVAAGFIKYLLIMANSSFTDGVLFPDILRPYFREIPNVLNSNQSYTEGTLFSIMQRHQYNTPCAILMLVIDKLEEFNNIPDLVPQPPTTMDSAVSQRISSFISSAQTLTPDELVIQSRNARNAMLLKGLSPEITEKFMSRYTSLKGQVYFEARKEILKITPQTLVSYRFLWSNLVHGTPPDPNLPEFGSNTVNIYTSYYIWIAYKTIYHPILEEAKAPTMMPPPGSEVGPPPPHLIPTLEETTQHVQAAITRMNQMNLQQLNRAMASGFLKMLTVMLNTSISLGTVHGYCMDIIPEVLKTNKPTEFDNFSKSVDVPSAIYFLVIDSIATPELLKVYTPPITKNANVTKVIDALFERLKIITPARVRVWEENSRNYFFELEKSRGGERYMDTVQVEGQGYSVLAPTDFNKAVPQIIVEVHTALSKITPDEFVSYPVWPAFASENLLVDNDDTGNTFLISMFIISYVAIYKTIFEQSQPPLRRPAGIIAWLEANRSSVPEDRIINLDAAITRIKDVFPDATTPELIQKEAGKLSVETPTTPIPAAIVAWLRSRLWHLQIYMRARNVAASTYVKRAFPAETATKVSEKELIML
jgi:hypothetical protein